MDQDQDDRSLPESSSSSIHSSASRTSQAQYQVRLASGDVVQETKWTEEEFRISRNWLEDFVAHLSALGEGGTITSTAKGRLRPTPDELRAITLTFENKSVEAHRRTPTTSSLAEVAKVLAEGTLEQMRSNGSVRALFKLGSQQGITDIHPLYRSLSIEVTDLTDLTDLTGETSTRSLESISEESE